MISFIVEESLAVRKVHVKNATYSAKFVEKTCSS